MHLSVAVFLAFTVIYFASVALPAEQSMKAVGWTAQATSLTAAVATFFALQSHKTRLLPASSVLLAAIVVSVLVAMAFVRCANQDGCEPALSMHGMVFSSGFLTGTAGYVGFTLAIMIGLPAWASIVVAVMFSPVVVAFLMPFMAKHITQAVEKWA